MITDAIIQAKLAPYFAARDTKLCADGTDMTNLRMTRRVMMTVGRVKLLPTIKQIVKNSSSVSTLERELNNLSIPYDAYALEELLNCLNREFGLLYDVSEVVYAKEVEFLDGNTGWQKATNDWTRIFVPSRWEELQKDHPQWYLD